MKSYHEIILRPLMTEKSSALKASLNRVVFEVHPDANKIEVRRAVEEAFKVKVADVNIISVKGKVKRLGRKEGRRKDWKKAVVTLREGHTIEFFQGA